MHIKYGWESKTVLDHSQNKWVMTGPMIKNHLANILLFIIVIVVVVVVIGEYDMAWNV